MGTCSSLTSKAAAFCNTPICHHRQHRKAAINSIETQTDEVYFKIIEKIGSTVNLKEDLKASRYERFSMVAHKNSDVFLNKKSDGPLVPYEDILLVIENLQNMCSHVSVKDQITILCSMHYLRTHCELLDGQRLERKRTSSTHGMAIPDDPEVGFWLSTFAGEHTIQKPSRRFKRAVIAVRSAILLAGSFKNATFVAEHVKDDSAYSFYLRKNLYAWDFDPFEMDLLASQRSISAIFREIILVSNLVSEFKLDLSKLDAFCAVIEEGYNVHKNPYHNEIHGADVLQTIFCLLSKTNIAKWLSSLELLAMLFAAMIHDVEHTGTNNLFHQKTTSHLAILYNDKSVLENHHISTAFKALQNPNLDPFQCLSKAQFKGFREIVIECVLATDMANHFNQVTNLKSTLINPSSIMHQDMMNTILHCADISAPAKHWDLHSKWTGLLMEEFFAQGAMEEKLGLPISPLCDRKNTNIAESQIGFITYITTPCFKVLGDAIDALLQEQQRQDFFALNGYPRRNSLRAKKRSGARSQQESNDTMFLPRLSTSTTLTPVEETSRNIRSETSFVYVPICRFWDKNFSENKAVWEEILKKDNQSSR